MNLVPAELKYNPRSATNGGGRVLEFDGMLFRSIGQFATTYELNAASVRVWLAAGMSPEAIIERSEKRKAKEQSWQRIVYGVTYASLEEVARVFGNTAGNLREGLRVGKTLEDIIEGKRRPHPASLRKVL